MKRIIDGVLSYEVFVQSLISSIGYGLGYTIPSFYDLHPLICLVFCIVLGTIFDKLADKILKARTMIKSTKNRIVICGLIYIFYLIIWVIVDYLYDYDLDRDVFMNIGIVLVFQIVSVILIEFKNYFKNIKKS